MSICMYIRIHTYIIITAGKNVAMRACMYVCMYVCIYVATYVLYVCYCMNVLAYVAIIFMLNIIICSY